MAPMFIMQQKSMIFRGEVSFILKILVFEPYIIISSIWLSYVILWLMLSCWNYSLRELRALQVNKLFLNQI